MKLSQIYQYNQQENAYIVQISLDKYEELYNGWDAAPMKRRDIEPDLLEFIEQVAYDIPLEEKIVLCFQLPESEKDEKKEVLAKEAIYHNFTIIRHFINKESSRNNRKIFAYSSLGIIFLTLTYIFQNMTEITFPFSIFFEGLFIGGWVMFWEAFSLFFFTGSELRGRRKRYARYSDSLIQFEYKQD